MEKSLFREIDVGNEYDFKLNYYILRDGDNGFGIEVDKLREDTVIEHSMVLGFSSNLNETVDIASKAAAGTVSPLALRDVISDYIVGKIHYSHGLPNAPITRFWHL